jgi:hypothetical protein
MACERFIPDEYMMSNPTSIRQAAQLFGGVERAHTRVRGFAPWSPEQATALLDRMLRRIRRELSKKFVP